MLARVSGVLMCSPFQLALTLWLINAAIVLRKGWTCEPDV
jgi:hypothetical protein